MRTVPVWHQQMGHQRDWIWRGWQTRYTYLRGNQVEGLPPMMLLHGFGASIGHWRQNLPELGRHHTVYALDLLGFGASAKVTAPYDVSFWVEQVYEFWQTFIRRPVILVGNSIGSLIALSAAAQYPEMVCGIVMLNLPDSSVLENPQWVTTIVSFLSPVAKPLLNAAKGILTLPPVFNLLFWVIRQPPVLRSWAKQAYATPTAITEELLEIFSTPAYEKGAARSLRAMINGQFGSKTSAVSSHTAKTVLPQLKIPMLLFWGLQDRMVPPSLARLFLNYNPDLTLIEIENAGHCPHDEYPDRVNREILNWVREWQKDG